MLNLIVIRSTDIDRAVIFYEQLGIVFIKHRHENGPEHYSAEIGSLIFEIYPIGKNNIKSTGVRLGFKVQSIDIVIDNMQRIQIYIDSSPQLTEWGRQIVIEDYDGHTIELTEVPVY